MFRNGKIASLAAAHLSYDGLTRPTTGPHR